MKIDLPEPGFRERLLIFGFTDADIDAAYESPLHKFLINMNLTLFEATKEEFKIQNDAFQEKMLHDVAEIIKDQWPNALKKAMESIDAKFDLIMLALSKQTKSVKNLNTKFDQLQNKQKDHDERILKLEGRLELLFRQYKLNHPKREA
jgi:site-specific DNA-cytosine methylase